MTLRGYSQSMAAATSTSPNSGRCLVSCRINIFAVFEICRRTAAATASGSLALNAAIMSRWSSKQSSALRDVGTVPIPVASTKSRCSCRISRAFSFRAPAMSARWKSRSVRSTTSTSCDATALPKDSTAASNSARVSSVASCVDRRDSGTSIMSRTWNTSMSDCTEVRVTRAPRFRSITTSPRRSNTCSASRIGVRDTPSRSPSSVAEYSLSGTRSPSRIAALSASIACPVRLFRTTSSMDTIIPFPDTRWPLANMTPLIRTELFPA